MNKKWAMKWADYLENPNLRQTKNALCIGRGRCCLGHAEIVAGNVFENAPNFRDGPERLVKGTNEYHVLTEETKNLFEMNDTSGSFSDKLTDKLSVPSKSTNINGYCYSLTEMNDSGYTLKEISKFIRKNWRYL